MGDFFLLGAPITILSLIKLYLSLKVPLTKGCNLRI